MKVALEAKLYVRRVRSFSRNARLYLVATTLQGLSFGIWGVIFNLYLKAVGFQDDFIGNMFMVNAIATGLVALPVGLLCERIGTRRAMLISQISNLFSIVQIVALQAPILLSASLLAGFIGTVGWVASMPFMTENSQREERTYLFSISWAIMTIMGVIGSFAGGAMPNLINTALGSTITEPLIGYQATLIISCALAIAGTGPLLLIEELKTIQRQKMGTLLSFRNVKNPSTIVKFMIPTGLIGFGAGFIVPLFNLFFSDKFHATDEQIGIIFALGNIVLGIFTMVAPMLSNKMGKVKAVVVCQYLSMPFIMLITLAPNLAFATFAYLARGALMNMAGPITGSLQMELVSESERSTTSGLMVMADMIPRAITASIAGAMMTINDFYTPFLFTTTTYLVGSSLFFAFFRRAEKERIRDSN